MSEWKLLQISRRGVAMDPRTGDSYRLNESATLVLRGMQEGASPQEMAEGLVREFNVPYGSALSDVYEFAAMLNSQGFSA